MSRVELLLEKVLHRLDCVNSPASSKQLPTFSTPDAVTPANDNAPVLSLFQNELVSVFPLKKANVLLMVIST